jgi:hypothetical protein
MGLLFQIQLLKEMYEIVYTRREKIKTVPIESITTRHRCPTQGRVPEFLAGGMKEKDESRDLTMISER